MSEFGVEPSCVACGMRLPPQLPESTQTTRFCPYCGRSLDSNVSSSPTSVTLSALTHEGAVSLPRGKPPSPSEVQFSIGPYQVLRSLGKGGMGEVFLVYDPTCGRRIALKRIREDLVQRQQLHNRFLKEARLTSQLTHPAIIPIYSIHATDNLIYYTMPYVEGESLRQILRTTRQQEKKGLPLHPIGGSIPSLVRIFMTVCQAVAYAHAEGVLHRDLKPENVMVGPYGEVLILDWGLAKLLESPDEPEVPQGERPRPGATRMGKVVGTATYIAPERALGQPATIQTEVYSLGVILYQLLTLHTPFGRQTMRDLRKTMTQGIFIDPAEVAPYRDTPPMLSQIASKCLAFNIQERYKDVPALIHDLELFLEGRSEWLHATTLDIRNKGDWEFQENVLISEHTEITRHTDESGWVSLMISRSSFPGNVMVDVKVTLGEQGSGLGILIKVPEAGERVHLTDGYCLWIGSEKNRDTKLLRSGVEVMSAPDIFLKRHVTYDIRIEKIDSNLHLSIDGQLQLSYNSPLPINGTHVGLLSRDDDFDILSFKVFSGSQNLNVSCLSVPDAFLAHSDHTAALAEYRRIGYSFPGRAEGREALFRAGITLLDLARQQAGKGDALEYYDLALNEFAKLRTTPGAPLEYLGKALVYQAQEEFEEEVKCFELALRRYKAHPLLHLLQDRVMHRMHESSRSHRLAAYHFALLAARHLPTMSHLPNAQKLFNNFQKHWEPLPFLINKNSPEAFAISLAFWVARPYALLEICQEISDPPLLDDALFCLIELGSWQLAQSATVGANPLLEIAYLCHSDQPSSVVEELLTWDPENINDPQRRILIHIIEQALSRNDNATALLLSERFYTAHHLIAGYRIWALLAQAEIELAGQLLHSHAIEMLSDEKKPFHFLYGCFLQATEGRELAHIHFAGTLEVTYPRLWGLLGHYESHTAEERDLWLKKTFLWERRHLYRQLTLYSLCAGEPSRAEHFRKLERDTYLTG